MNPEGQKSNNRLLRLLQKFPKSENRRGILPRNILKINDLSGKMPDLFAAKFDFCKSLMIYIIPLALIVLFFSITLGSRKLTEWQGQVLKLISGLMMLSLGFVLLINPALFNNIFVAVGLLAIVLTTAGIMVFIARRLRRSRGKG